MCIENYHPHYTSFSVNNQNLALTMNVVETFFVYPPWETRETLLSMCSSLLNVGDYLLSNLCYPGADLDCTISLMFLGLVFQVVSCLHTGMGIMQVFWLLGSS